MVLFELTLGKATATMAVAGTAGGMLLLPTSWPRASWFIPDVSQRHVNIGDLMAAGAAGAAVPPPAPDLFQDVLGEVKETGANLLRGLIGAALSVVPSSEMMMGGTCVVTSALLGGYNIEVDDQDETATGLNKNMRKLASHALAFHRASDAFIAGALLHSCTLHVVTPLQTWAVGSLLLSFPATELVRRIVDHYGVRAGFLLELALTVSSWLWLTGGTVLLSSIDTSANDSSPLLWWSCFLVMNTAWSCLITGVVTLVGYSVGSQFNSSQSAPLAS
eukprot:NODE_14470_length_1107_cov_4.942857.p1 GENE.NODE_14470_length_1107_cov_4.942857~~NODE_14470_length_1107_cov_4.942857.p1  ORF type:complete len:276 (-),score=61.42 NODE_14470_length_1107_cov_4.942857:90-917(-)